METGDYGTLRELAKAEDINILDGRQAETMTLARLMKVVPVTWAEQR